jgi:quercetin dioxygenase-like cupin family protein
MAEESKGILDSSFYTGERTHFTLADLVKYHVSITKKFVVRQDEVKLEPAHGEKGYRKGLYDFPNSIVAWGLTEIDPGVRAPMHRQLHEATHLIIEGKGYSIVNDQRIDWEEGDVVFVPMQSWHTQGNDGKGRARYVTAGTIPFFRHLGIYRKENNREPSRDEMELLTREMPPKLLIKKKDWFEQAATGKNIEGEGGIVHFDFPYKIGYKGVASNINPRSESQFVHTHFNEALIYIVNGTGFSLVHDRKVEWEKGCVMRVPTMAWHHHYNESDEPVVYLKNITSGLNNHFRWIVLDNLPPKDIGETTLATLAAGIKGFKKP